MKGLTKEQLDFLESQGIPLNLVFDAEGYSKQEYNQIMKEQKKAIAFNVSSCYNGHSLRNRHGHCVQCDTARIAFALRSFNPGVVYLAGSVAGQLIKVGYSKSKEIREASLNKTKYGGYNDWQVIYSVYSFDALEIEHKTQSGLVKYSTGESYEHDGHKQATYELFRCSYDKAKTTIDEVIYSTNIQVSNQIEHKVKIPNYRFRNLARWV